MFTDYAYDIIASLTAVTVCSLSVYRYLANQYLTAYPLFVLALLVIASSMDLCSSQQLLHGSEIVINGNEAFERTLIIVNVLALCCSAGNILIYGLRDTIVYCPTSKKFRRTCEEESWSPWANFVSVNLHRTVVNIISKTKTNVSLFPKPSLHYQCARMVEALYRKVGKGAPSRSKRHFLNSVWSVMWADFLWITAVCMANSLNNLARALVLEALIAGTSSMSSMVLLFAATCIAEGAFASYQANLTYRVSERIQVLCQGAILRKVMSYSATARASTSTGYIVSVISVDCVLISMSTQLLLLPLTTMLTMPLALYMLTVRVGLVPGLSCAAFFLVGFGGFWIAIAVYHRMQKRSMKLRDDRLKQMLDLLSSIRTVKMYAWENSHMERLKLLREEELKQVLKVNILNGVIDAFYSAASSLLVIVMYGTLALIDPTRLLSPSESFSSVYLLSIIENFYANLTLIMRTINVAGIAANRVISLCTAEETDDSNTATAYSCTQKGEVVLQDCTFTRTEMDSAPALSMVNLSIPPGSLVVIVGFVGSGKSTLLAAILGDLRCTEGTMRISGNIGYVPQMPTVFNATLRDNILFGKKYDPVLYRQVLDACDLIRDISTFPAGDLTEIGEKGHNLSGGQKQRVSLARAAYHQCSIYVLDDPLSALDPHVGSRVYKRLLGKKGMLKNKTRLLVTNQGYLLKEADQLYLMCGKSGISYSRTSELLKDIRAPATLRLGLAGLGSAEKENRNNALEDDEDQSKGKIIQEEGNVSTKSTAEVVWSGVKMCGHCLLPGVLFLAASAIATSWQLVWIKQWTDSSASGNEEYPYDPVWMQGLAALCLGAVATRLIGNVLLSYAINRFSRVLHHGMLDHVLFSPMSFFDGTPRGRIMNRFSSDLNDVDIKLASLGRQTIQNSLLALSRLAVIGTESLVVIVVGFSALVIFIFGLVILTRAVNATRFIRSAEFSRVLQHVTETVESLTIVRVFGMTQRFYSRFCNLADRAMRFSLASAGCQRLTRTFAAACSQFVVLVALISIVAVGGGAIDEQGDASRSSSIGMALNAALAIPMMMTMLCISYTGVTLVMVALERDLEFTELPKEPPVESDITDKAGGLNSRSRTTSVAAVNHLDETWPAQGSIEFRNFYASYRPSLIEDTLKNVSFSILSREKVGIVGRTGSGKSSLVLALLRMLKSTGGQILIDGVDIASVPLSILRTAVTVIPQDPTLVRGTLRTNLDPTHKHSDEELWQVLRQTHLSEFVAKQPLKLFLETGDGGCNLSAGQRQLVCLARALLRKPRILVLDEATSQMDGDTDRLIQATLRESFANFTLLTVAHRLHTVLDYDKILVMSEGTVVEYGPVAQLLKDESSLFHDMAIKAGILSTSQQNVIDSSETSTKL